MISFPPHPSDQEGVIAMIDGRTIGHILPVKQGVQSWFEWKITVGPDEVGSFDKPVSGTSATLAGAKASLTGRWGWLLRHQQQQRTVA
jgi:hypothetical protein